MPPFEPLTTEDLRERFFYHPPSEKGAEAHGMLSEFFLDVAQQVNDLCPEGRDKSLAFTKLEEAKMHASAAIARNPDTR